MASSIKGFASSNAIKVWKAKKKKLKEKLGTVIKEENEVRTMLQHYVDQSRERVKELCSKEDIVVFNQEYEDVSSSLDMCINELFEFRMAIKLRLDNVNSDSESVSSDEGSFKSIDSRTTSAGTFTGRESAILEMDDGKCKSITHSTPLQDNRKTTTYYGETMEEQSELLDKEHRISVTKMDNFHGTPQRTDSLLHQLPSELLRQYQEHTTTGIENFHGVPTSTDSLLHRKQSLIACADGVVPVPLSEPKLKNIEKITTTTENLNEGLRSTNSLLHQKQSPILCEAEAIPVLALELKDQQHDVKGISTLNNSDGQNMNDHSLSPELKITPETFRRGLDGIVNAFMEDPSRESLTSDVQEESIEHKPTSSSCLSVPNLPSLPNKAAPKVLDSNQSAESTLFNNKLKPHLISKLQSSFDTKSAAEDPISDLSSTYAPASNEILHVYDSRIIRTSVEKSDLTAHGGHVEDNENSFGVSTSEFTDLSFSKTTTNHQSAMATSIPTSDQYKNSLSTLNPEAPMFKILHQTLNKGQVPLNICNPKDIQSELTMQDILQQSKKLHLSFPVKVTHINDLDDFYVSLNPEGTTALLTHLCDYFEKRKDILHPASLLEVNNLYMASISATNIIRCRLLGCIENVYTVQNLDVGNVIQIQKSALFDLPDHIKWPYVFQCALHHHHLIKQWQSPVIVEKFKEFCMMQNIFAKFRYQQEQKIFLDLNFKYNDSEISIQEYFYELFSTENSTKNSCDEGKKITCSTTEKPHVPRKDVDTNSSSGRSTPEHSFDWKASIKTPYCPDIKDGSFERIPCLVSFVESPSNFYVQLALKESGATMIDDQLSKMNSFYSTLKLKEPVYKKVAVQPKSVWCCQNPGSQDSYWYRVQILSFVEDVCSSSDASNTSKVGTRKKKHRSMNPTTMLQALCVDYGDTITVMLKDLFPLAKQFLELPALAVQCSLARIAPVNELLDWPAETTSKLIEFAPLEQAREVEILEITGYV